MTTLSASAGARDRLIVALDFPSAEPALELAHQLSGVVRWLKVGLELYTAAGPEIVRKLRGLGFDVFLDLKLYDIPNTVAGAVRSAAQTGAGLLTVHASGGPAMLRAAQAEAAKSELKLLAVTVLTSMDSSELFATGITQKPAAQVERLAHMAAGCGIHGLVCSAEEVSSLRRLLGESAILVTPGIRPAGSDAGDQKRTAAPAAALAGGASYLVVGRPVTQAADPVGAARAILDEMQAAKSPA